MRSVVIKDASSVFDQLVRDSFGTDRVFGAAEEKRLRFITESIIEARRTLEQINSEARSAEHEAK